MFDYLWENKQKKNILKKSEWKLNILDFLNKKQF